jgi:SRSO17 transposase
MMSMREPYAPYVDQDASAVQGGAAYLSDLERRLAPYFERAEPRQRAMAYLRGLLNPAERKNSWQLAEVSGDMTPYAFQHLLRRALWDPEAVRDELCRYLTQHLGDPEAVLVIDETGFLKKGRHSAGVARQYSGTAGRIENCQVGVFLGYASRLGQALLDRELYLPKEWTNDAARCRQAGIPAERRFATKLQLAQQTLQRALVAGVPARWVTGDCVYGNDRRLRLWVEAQPWAYVLAVSGQEYVWLGWQQRQVKTRPGRAAEGRLDTVERRRWRERSALVRLAVAALGRSRGPAMAPLALGVAQYKRPQSDDGVCGLCAPGDPAGGGGASRRQPLDD